MNGIGRSSTSTSTGGLRDGEPAKADDHGAQSGPLAGGKRREYLREYLRWLWPHRFQLAGVFALAVTVAGLEMIEPLFMRLFDGSERDNIAYGRKEATDAEVEDAARRANAHEFVERLPAGYETTIGERGVKLSGGQQQRLAIARAVLASPQILILDEATSNLDTESEQLIQASMAALLAGRTRAHPRARHARRADDGTRDVFQDGPPTDGSRRGRRGKRCGGEPHEAARLHSALNASSGSTRAARSAGR